MTFRTRLFWIFILAFLFAGGLLVEGTVLVTRRAFSEIYEQHATALAAQFQREFEQSRQDVARRVQMVADDEATVRMAIALSRTQADVSVYSNDASGVSQSHRLDFLDFVGSDGSVISSAEYPARIGYKMDWLTQPQDWASLGSFLTKVDTPDGTALGLVAVSRVRVGDKDLFVLGGQRVGRNFLASLVVPPGLRALLYRNLEPGFHAMQLLDQSGPVVEGDRFASFIGEEQKRPAARPFELPAVSGEEGAEMFRALPLLGRQQELLGVLLIGSSQPEAVAMDRRIRTLAASGVALGLLIALLLSWWGAAQITRPARKLAEATREISQGRRSAPVPASGRGEMAQLTAAFNEMSRRLGEERERLAQAERVAAWRELALRLARELETPLSSLQAAAQTLQSARERGAEEFSQACREAGPALATEIENLRKVSGRFSEFAGMPRPELSAVNLNESVRAIVKLFASQFGAVGRPPITPEFHLADGLPSIQADAGLLQRAMENLILNAMDAMPSGGVLMLRTSSENGEVHLEISDTGIGLTPEECERLFTPYYTTKQNAPGLGLAIVQSVVSDHGGRITVESETGVGTSFHIYLPLRAPQSPAAPAAGGVASSEKA